MFVNAVQAGNKMVFERADGTFGGVAPGNTGGTSKLEVNAFCNEKGFDGGGALIVKAM